MAYLAENLGRFEGKWNPLGFIVWHLGVDQCGNSLRLHAWPRNNRKVATFSPGVHCHAWYLSSYIIAGGYWDVHYNVIEQGYQPEEERIRRGYLRKFSLEYLPDGTSSLVNRGVCVTLAVREFHVAEPGEVHHIKDGIFHATSVPLALDTVTLVLDSPCLGYHTTTVLACASVWVLARQRADNLGPGQASFTDTFALSDESLRPMRQRPVQAVFLVFFASMAAYNIWPVLVPFALRAHAPSPALVAALAIALTLQPLLFGAVQLLIAHGLKGRPASDRGLLIGLVLAHGLSLLALRLAAQQSQPVAFAVLFLLGGGLLVAVIYPVCSLLLMRALEPVPIAQRAALQRRLIVQFGLVGDLGQLAGGGLLASGLVTAQPLDLFLLLGALALPALAALGLKASRSRAV